MKTDAEVFNAHNQTESTLTASITTGELCKCAPCGREAVTRGITAATEKSYNSAELNDVVGKAVAAALAQQKAAAAAAAAPPAAAVAAPARV